MSACLLNGVVFRGFAGACARCGTQWDPRGCGSPPLDSGGRCGVPRRLKCAVVGPGLLIGRAWGGCARCGSTAPCGSRESRWVARVAQDGLQSDMHGVTLLVWSSPVSRDNAGGCNVSIVSHPKIRFRGALKYCMVYWPYLLYR